jgi:serine/threonine-protein kinase
MAEADSEPPTRAVSAPGSAGSSGGMGSSAAASRAEGRVMGGYRLLDEIASGGMATVHLSIAESGPEPRPFVAIKRMHEHFARDPDFSSMFLDEATLCTRIRHENVVATIDVVHEEDELLLVLELVEGESLSKLVKQLSQRKARVPKNIASAIVADMLRGLHAAHEATNEAGEPLMIVHRDVSPHNVIVGTDGIAKVLDFGVAKARGRVQQTQKGQLKGKLAYMSPEQARGKPVDRRSDVFSSGIVLWELLAGRRLFDGDNEGALLVALLSEKPARLETVDPAMAPYAALVHKALETEPDARYQTALEMADAIAKGIPCASRAEVATWLKGEAKLSLARRDAMISRIRTKAALKAGASAKPAASPSPPRAAAPLPPPSMPRRPAVAPLPPPPTPGKALPITTSPATFPLNPRASAVDELWDTSTTTQDGTSHSPMAKATPFSTPPSVPTGGTERPPTPALVSAPTQPMPAASTPFALAPTLPASALHGRDTALAMQAAAVQAGQRQSYAPPAPLGTMTPASVRMPIGASSGGAILTPASPVSPRFFDRPSDLSEAMSSQVTMTTTDMPPPLPRDQVRRLTMVSAITAGVTVVTAVALLVIFSRKPWQSPQPGAAKSGAAVVTVPDKPIAPTTTPVPTPSGAPAESAAPSATATSGPRGPSGATQPRH